jgi:O-antigen ligase
MSKLRLLPVPSLSVVLIIWAVIWPLLIIPDREPAATIIAAGFLITVIVFVARRQGIGPPGLISGFILVYLALSIVAYFLSPVLDLSLRRLTALFAGAAGYGLAQVWMKEGQDRTRKLASGLVMVGGVMSVMALFIVEWPARYLIDLQTVMNRLPHISRDFYLNNNAAAGVILLMLPVAVALFLHTKKKTRFVYLASAMGMVVILLLTQSRNAYLGLIFGIVAGLLWERIRFRYVLVVLLLLVILPIAVLMLGETTDVKSAELVSAADLGSKGGSAQDQSWLSRLEIWSAAAQTMRDYPAVGAGLYAFAPISRANYVYQVVDPRFDISHAHNLFLQTGASLGWAGWLAIAGLWINVMYALWRTAKTSPSPDNSWLRRALTASIAGYIVFNSFDVLALEQRAGIFVWLILALVSAVIDESGITDIRYRWLWVVPVALYIVLLISPAFPTNLARLELDRARFDKSTLPLSGDVSNKLKEDYRRSGLIYYIRGDNDRALQIWKSDPEAGLFLLGQGQEKYFTSQAVGEAIDWYSLSISIDEESGQVYFWRGVAYMDLGDAERAMADFRSAVIHGSGEYYNGVPLDAMAWAHLGRGHLDLGELREAIYALEQAVSLAPDVADYRTQLLDIQNLHDLMQ